MLGVYAAGVQPIIEISNWPFILFVGLQISFYVESLTVIPDRIGYGVTYLVIFLGKVAVSAFVDSVGIAGARVPITGTRAVSLVFIILGFALYLTGREAEASSEHTTHVDTEMEAKTAETHEPHEDQHCLLNPSANFPVTDTV